MSWFGKFIFYFRSTSLFYLASENYPQHDLIGTQYLHLCFAPNVTTTLTVRSQDITSAPTIPWLIFGGWVTNYRAGAREWHICCTIWVTFALFPRSWHLLCWWQTFDRQITEPQTASLSIHLLILARDVLCGNRPISSIEVLKVSIARSAEYRTTISSKKVK